MADVSKVGPPLGQASGYGIVLGLGFAFALGMIGTTWALKRYHNEVQTSEAFSTAAVAPEITVWAGELRLAA